MNAFLVQMVVNSFVTTLWEVFTVIVMMAMSLTLIP